MVGVRGSICCFSLSMSNFFFDSAVCWLEEMRCFFCLLLSPSMFSVGWCRERGQYIFLFSNGQNENLWWGCAQSAKKRIFSLKFWKGRPLSSLGHFGLILTQSGGKYILCFLFGYMVKWIYIWCSVRFFTSVDARA